MTCKTNVKNSKMISIFKIALLLVSFEGLASGLDDFWFTEQPVQNYVVVSDQSVTLKCNVSTTKHITFYWTLRGETVKNTTRRYQDGSNMHITRVDPTKDSGEFTCIATNVSSGYSITSLGYSLAIQWLEEDASVELQVPKSSKEIKLGAPVALKCLVEGSSDVKIEWFYNGQRLFRNSLINFKNKRLHIEKMKVSMNGLYFCRGSNAVGTVESKNKFPLIAQDEDVVKIKVIPKDVIVKKEDTARFDCSYDEPAVVKWYFKDSVLLTNDSRVTVFKNGSLSIKGIRGSDRGLYACAAQVENSDEDDQQKFVAKLTIAYLQNFPEHPFEPKFQNDQNIVMENSAFEVDCKHPDGLPKPRVWWEDPKGRVIYDSGHVRVEDGRLIIDGATKSDSGRYYCFAENTASQKSRGLLIEVTIPPRITSDPVDIPMIDEGDSTSLTCSYKASPYPLTEVMWLKNGNYLHQFGGHYVMHKNNGTLNINGLSMGDVGKYVCEVRTQGYPPVRSQAAQVFIKEKLKFVPAPVNRKLELGSNSKIYCKASGASKPTVRWAKENENLFDFPSHIIDEDGTLYFNGVKREDAGKYMCVATNSQGLINQTIRVDVIVSPQILVKPVDTTAYIGDSVMIHCKAYSDPDPAIQWDKNSVMGGFGNRFRILDNGTLFIEKVELEDQGSYGCIVGNMGGFKREEMVLTIRDRNAIVGDATIESATKNETCDPYVENCNKDGFMLNTVVITLSAAAGYMLLVVGLMIWCRCRRAKRRNIWMTQTDSKAGNEMGSQNGIKSKDGTLKNGKPEGIRSDNEVPSHHSTASHTSKKSRSSYDRLHFPRHDLQMNNAMLLGKGEFGEVFLSRARGIIDGESESTVIVKLLQSRDEDAQFEFKREMDLFHKLKHCNIAHLLGISREVEPIMMILEYSDVGDLKQYLLATRNDNQRKGSRPPPLDEPQILNICYQIALGMENLSNHRFIHKDLAARNCLISSSFNVKITMQQLCCDTYSSEYVRYKNRFMPARWMAPEAFLEDEYSVKSDVWSFAVLVWEIFTQAKLPFSDLCDSTIIDMLEQNCLRWNPPEEIPTGLINLLMQCWSESPKYRPTFSEVVIQLGDMSISD